MAERLSALGKIDWSKKNKDWENVCIIANSVVSNRQARAATKAYIKAKLHMELTEAKKRLGATRSRIGFIQHTVKEALRGASFSVIDSHRPECRGNAA